MHRSVRHPSVIPGIDVISIRSDRSFPRHSHDEFGIGYLVSGGQESWSGRGLVEAEAGDIITVNPSELHDGIGRSGKPRHWRMLFLSPAAVETYAERRPGSVEFDRPVIRRTMKRRLVEAAVSALTQDRPDPAEIEEQVMLAVRGTLETENAETAAKAAERSRAVQRVLDRIHDAPQDALFLSDYAAVAGMSRFQILRRFTKEVGTTPHAYLTQYRVKRAKREISAGVPLAEAAVSAGFSDQSHLTRVFARQYGVTPGRYFTARPG